VWLLLLALTLAAIPAGAERAALLLTERAGCVVGGEHDEVPVADVGGRPALRHAPGPPLDFHLRLPAEASLSFGLDPALSRESWDVEVAHDTGTAAIALRPEGDGWRADLSPLAGRVVRLRFANRASEAIHWTVPRVSGRGVGARAVLPPPPEPAPRPNLLFYVVDTLRPDRLSLHGYGRETSPHLEALARRATVFDNAYSNGHDTMSAIPALFTSLMPDAGLRELRRPRRPLRPTLAQAFDDAGYATVAFQANPTIPPALGFDRGFLRYTVLQERGEPRVSAETLNAAVIPWLAQPRQKPFFLYVQSMDVHNPYEAPAPILGRWSDPDDDSPLASVHPDRYDEAVAYADREIGKLLRALDEAGLSDSTAIVVTSDHGEALGEGGRRLHSVSLHEEQIRIPLLVALPWQREPARVEELVSLLDLFPTLVVLAGRETPERSRGRSLFRATPWYEPAIALGETTRLETPRWYLREGPWKLRASADGARLFHLPSDPTEERDLTAEKPVTAAYLEGLLWDRAPGYRRATAAVPHPILEGLDAEQRKKLEGALRSLGYID